MKKEKKQIILKVGDRICYHKYIDGEKIPGYGKVIEVKGQTARLDNYDTISKYFWI